MLLRIFLAMIAVGLFIPAKLLLPGATAKVVEQGVKAGEQRSNSKAAKEITALVAKSEKSWNKGDLDAFMSDYLYSNQLTYVSNGTVKRGYKEIHDHYVDRYGKSKASMGQLFLTDLEISDLSDKHVLCIGKFTVVHHSHVPIYGRFSLIYVLTKEGWKIMYDHSSQ